jgi:hypothetical protein
MNFLPTLLQGISLIPAVVQALEGVSGAQSGASKKAAALSFIQSAVSATGPAAANYIVDSTKFQDGLSKVIDGVVECLNASVWAEKHSPLP